MATASATPRKSRRSRKRKQDEGLNRLTVWQKIKRDKFLLILLLPGLICLLLFAYAPMFGVLIAFQDFNPWKGFSGSEWVGLRQFQKLLGSAEFWRVFRNTVVLSLETYLFSFPIAPIFAILLNEARGKRYKKITQTVTYLPHFITTVVIAGMVVTFCSPSGGFISSALGALMGTEPPYIMATPTYFRPVYILTNIWINFGWGTIIYLSALSGVDPQQYEAATIDGAGRLQKIWHITLPALIPTMTICLIIDMGSVITGVSFDMILNLQNPGNISVSEVLSTLVYKQGLLGSGISMKPTYSYSTAVNLFTSLLGTIMITSANAISRKVNDRSLW